MMRDLSDRDLERLLGRAVRARLDAEDRRALAGRRVLVTGAGGSIGAELARQIASCAPDHLALVDRSEIPPVPHRARTARAVFRLSQSRPG